jgi:DNA-binding transcriptional regulator YdaS (Cro superfamily)
MSEKQPLRRLLEERGLSLSDLARRLGVNKSSITLWGLRRIPAERVLEIEKLTGIPRHDLRPDIYPAPEQSGAAA